MRGAFIGGALDQKARAILKNELCSILSGSSRQKEQFLQLADEAIDEHFKIFEPFHIDAEHRKLRLERLVAAGKEFSKAINAIDTDLYDIIYQEHIVIERRAGAEVNNAMAAAKLAMRRLSLASETGVNVGTVGRHILGRGVSKPSVPAFNQLVRQLAHGYDSIFKEQPSWSSRGTFAQAVDAVFRAGKVKDAAGKPVQVGQSRLRTLLRVEFFQSPPPARGRKAKQS